MRGIVNSGDVRTLQEPNEVIPCGNFIFVGVLAQIMRHVIPTYQLSIDSTNHYENAVSRVFDLHF
jgi:hypothetical protein